MAAAAVAGGPCGVEEGRGIDAHDPSMAVGGNIGVDIEVVAHGEPGHECVEIGCDVQMGRGFFFSSPSVHAIAGKGWIAVGAGHIAEHFVIGAVFANHEKAVLEVRQRRAVGNGCGVGCDDGLRGFFSGGRLPRGMALTLPNSSEPT
jgi:hypothetical protein